MIEPLINILIVCGAFLPLVIVLLVDNYFWERKKNISRSLWAKEFNEGLEDIDRALEGKPMHMSPEQKFKRIAELKR